MIYIKNWSTILAAGGFTTLVDMPIHSKPPITSTDSFFKKTAAANGKVTKIISICTNYWLSWIWLCHFLSQCINCKIIECPFSALSMSVFGAVFVEVLSPTWRTLDPCSGPALLDLNAIWIHQMERVVVSKSIS